MIDSPRPCPFCDKPTILAEVTVRVRRGERIIPVGMAMWECPAGCKSERGDQPFRFVDQGLAAENDGRTRVAWRLAFGEEVPEPQRPGRKPRERRSQGVRVMLTGSELVALDRERGEMSRSEYLRRRALGGSQHTA